jgi:hypothetical protein
MENFVPSESEALRNLHQQSDAAIFERARWPANPSRFDEIERICIGTLDPELVHVHTPNEEEGA